MKISLCLIVKNEEKTLGNCLESFSPLVEEIIIVDTGSTDKTKKIATDFNSKIFDFQWIDDFAAARNFALQKATKEWIMMVDADDIMEKDTLKALSNELSHLENMVEIISLPYVYQRSEGNNKNTAYLPRIWKRSLQLEWKYPIHEYLDFSQVPKDRIRKLNLTIFHQKENLNFKNSFKRNVAILKNYLLKQPKDLRILYYMVHDSYQLEDWEAVIEWSEKYLDSNPKDSIKTCRTLARRGWAHLKKGEFVAAQEAFLLANGVNALLIEPYLALGDFYKSQKRYDEAIHMYECARLCKIPKDQSNAFYNPSMYNYSALRKLTYLLPLVGKKEEAMDYGEKTLKYCPNDEKLISHLQNLKKELNQP